MAQRSISLSTCQAKSLQRRPSKLRLSYCKPKSEDDIDSNSRPHRDKSDRLHRTQSLKFSRRSKVLYKAKGKSMIKITLSPVTPPEDKYTDIELHHEGTKGEPCTPKRYDKSFKFYVDECNIQYDLPADIIFKSDLEELEIVAVLSLLDIDKTKTIACNTVDLRASSPELTFSDLRIFDNSKGFLCEQEQQFQKKRKLKIHTALQKLLMTSLEKDDVPHIALMGSGGGYRAMVAMSGIINALYTSKVLECILYTAVLSGSSWFIAMLYSHPDWPKIDPKDIQTRLKKLISRDPIRIWTLLHKGLACVYGFLESKLTGKAWNFTTDIFAPMLGNVLIPNRLKCRWSEQRDKLSEGTVPLPLLAAIHAKDEQNTNEFHEWVEFSPYEVSIPKYGAAIDMKNFGSEFDKGLLKQHRDEIPLFEIMGICGSAFTQTYDEWARTDASNRTYSTTQKSDKQGSVDSDEVDGTLSQQDYYDNDIKSSECDVFESGCVSDEREKEHRQPQSITPQPSEKELEDLFERVCQIREEGGRTFEEKKNRNEKVDGDTCKEDRTHADELDSKSGDIKRCGQELLMKSRSVRAATVNNFLRKVSFDDTYSCPLSGEKNPLFENYLKNDLEKLCLIDAGLAFNSPYPLLFQPGRDVDLILSFDFTDRKKDSNDPFETIRKAEAWASTHDIKFPQINFEEYEGKPVQELYIFEDNKDPYCPIIMHFVLVNNKFRTFKSPEVKRRDNENEFANFTVYDDQSTFHCTNFQYSEKNFDRLSQLSEFIVLNNIENVKKCISKSINNKRERKPTGRQRHKTAPL
ncbi:cytosolic phospholipase A2-like [Mytilus trossulus]|uniref:cytosolic phospholipase A2-like n=1 Tax=Mytilus trossulus TaxID=6551 RepID=UPI0030050357